MASSSLSRTIPQSRLVERTRIPLSLFRDAYIPRGEPGMPPVLAAASNYPGKIIARSFVDRNRALITRITRIAKNGVC